MDNGGLYVRNLESVEDPPQQTNQLNPGHYAAVARHCTFRPFNRAMHARSTRSWYDTILDNNFTPRYLQLRIDGPISFLLADLIERTVDMLVKFAAVSFKSSDAC